MSIIEELNLQLTQFTGESRFVTIDHPKVLLSKGFLKLTCSTNALWVIYTLYDQIYTQLSNQTHQPAEPVDYTGTLFNYKDIHLSPFGRIPLWVQFNLYHGSNHQGELIYQAMNDDQLVFTDHFNFNLTWDGQFIHSRLTTEAPMMD